MEINAQNPLTFYVKKFFREKNENNAFFFCVVLLN